MRKPLRKTAVVVMIGTTLLVQQAAPASAASNVTIRSGDGDTLRARSYEHANFTGAVLSYYGSSACTTTTTDADFSYSVMPPGWNDIISSVRDYNSCDVNLYADNGFAGGSTGYVNYSTGRNLSSSWNDRTSSFRVS